MSDTFLALIDNEKTNILARFPKLNEYLTPEIFWTVVQRLDGDKRLAKAAEVNPSSVITALLDLASWGLVPDGKEAFINSYEITQHDGSKLMTAQAQWMWPGGVRRAVESHIIRHAVPDVIRTGDTLEEIVDEKGRRLTHKRDITKAGRAVVGSYCLFWLNNGLMDYELCDLEDIERAKAASKRQNHGKLTPAWEYAYPEQAKKTAVRRGLKRMVGKRGMDAGLDSMVSTQTSFDAEIDGVDIGTLSEEETPRATETVELVLDNPPLAAGDFAEVEDDNPDAPSTPAEQEAFKQYVKGRNKPQDIKLIKNVSGWTDVAHASKRQLRAAQDALRDAK